MHTFVNNKREWDQPDLVLFCNLHLSPCPGNILYFHESLCELPEISACVVVCSFAPDDQIYGRLVQKKVPWNINKR